MTEPLIDTDTTDDLIREVPPGPTKQQLDVDAARELVKQAEADLIAAGFEVVNGPGDLASRDRTTWVTKSYSTGEYRIDAFRRSTAGGKPFDRCRIRVRSEADRDLVHSYVNALSYFGHEPPPARHRRKAQWPPAVAEAYTV